MDNFRFCRGISFICLHMLMGWTFHLNAEGLYVRVVDGANGNQGNVEVYDSGTDVWYSICRDTWDDHAANVVCRMLGYTSVSGHAMKMEILKQGWNRNVSCKGNEALMSECELTPISFRNCYVAGVDCSNCGRPKGFFLMGGNDNVIRMDDTTWAYIQIPKPDSNEIHGLSYDVQADAIYWTDRSNVINLSLITGSISTMFTKEKGERKRRESADDDEYLGLAVDTYKRLLFFGDYNQADIWKVDLDNSEEKVKILNSAVEVQHIEVDPEIEKIYWLDLHNDVVREADYDGKNSRAIMNRIIYFGLTEIFTLDDEYVYIANKKATAILVYGRSVRSKRYIDISMYKNYQGITQWNDHIYLISKRESQLIKVNKDSSSVETTGPPIKNSSVLTSLRHYTLEGVTISTTSVGSTIDTTAKSLTTTLQPILRAIDSATSSMPTTLLSNVTSSTITATTTTTISQTTLPRSTLEVTTTKLSDTTTSEYAVGASMSTTSLNPTVDPTPNSLTTTLQQAVSIIVTAASSSSTTLPPPATNSNVTAPATTSMSKNASRESTLDLTIKVSSTTIAGSTFAQGITFRGTATSIHQRLSNAGASMSTTSLNPTVNSTANSLTTTLQPAVSVIDNATSSKPTTLPPPVTSSNLTAPATTTISKTTSNESTLDLTSTVSSTTVAESTVAQGITFRSTATTTHQRLSNAETTVLSLSVAIVMLILGIGLGIFIYRRCCTSLLKTPSDNDNYLTSVSTRQEQGSEIYDMPESTNTISTYTEDEPVYCEILPDNLCSTLSDDYYSDITSSYYLEPISKEEYKRNDDVGNGNGEGQVTFF